ncbi:efflux RND transporter periplasmic adaptor subunit, partial [Nitrospirota bacterium]
MKNSLIAIALLLIAGLLAFGLKALKPKVKKGRARPSTPIVSTIELSPTTHSIHIKANGTVIPARQIELLAQVEGMAVYVTPELIPGGLIKKGTVLLRIDPTDYDLEIRNKKAQVADAKLNLELEKARQGIAFKEWESLSEGSSMEGNRPLALRGPHLEKALASLDAAESSLEVALVAQKRTIVKSPFNALVLEQNVTKGQLISRQKPVATLVDTDEFWIEASVPLDKLKWISFPTNKQKRATQAEVSLNLGGKSKTIRKAEAYRLYGQLDPKGRMAKVLFRLPDPLCLNKCDNGLNGNARLLMGSFVDIQIDAGAIDNAFSIPRSAMRDNNTVWILDSNNCLVV